MTRILSRNRYVVDFAIRNRIIFGALRNIVSIVITSGIIGVTNGDITCIAIFTVLIKSMGINIVVVSKVVPFPLWFSATFASTVHRSILPLVLLLRDDKASAGGDMAKLAKISIV